VGGFMDYYEGREQEAIDQRLDDQYFEPPFCDNCGGAHETDSCPWDDIQDQD
jgi:hypothetical protein